MGVPSANAILWALVHDFRWWRDLATLLEQHPPLRREAIDGHVRTRRHVCPSGGGADVVLLERRVRPPPSRSTRPARGGPRHRRPGAAVRLGRAGRPGIERHGRRAPLRAAAGRAVRAQTPAGREHGGQRPPPRGDRPRCAHPQRAPARRPGRRLPPRCATTWSPPRSRWPGPRPRAAYDGPRRSSSPRRRAARRSTRRSGRRSPRSAPRAAAGWSRRRRAAS